MPKVMIVKLEVPSGSRPASLLTWLNKLLLPHRMQVLSVTEDHVEVSKENKDEG